MSIHIIGTSHISRQSIDEIKRFVKLEKPDIIAIELDEQRVQALFSKQQRISPRAIFQVGLIGFLFASIGRLVQNKMGDIVGVKPGSDMKTAVLLARKNKIKLELIDQDIRITLMRFSKSFRAKEKWQLFKDLFSFKKVPFDISKVPEEELIDKLMDEIKIKYPGLYLALVEERNVVMARNLRILQSQNPDAKILAVVGAGHVKGIKKILQEPSPSHSYSFTHSYVA